MNYNKIIFNASGPLCTTEEELLSIENSNSGIVLSKSATLEKREGNPKPRYFDNDLGSINSMGLPNRGYKFYIEMAKKIKKPYFISVNGLTLNDTKTIIKDILVHNSLGDNLIQGIEVNLSCPNIIGKGQLAYDLEKMDLYLKEIFDIYSKYKNTKYKNTTNNENHNHNHNQKFHIGIKLPPYFDLHWFPLVTDILMKYPITFITCINSIGNGLIIDYEREEIVIKPKNGMGGIGGKYVKPTGLANVRNFYLEFQKRNLDIKIIGCGGIETGIDAFEYILAGADFLQIGTQFYKEGTFCFQRIEDELYKIMDSKNYTNYNQFRGKLKNI